MANLNLKRNSRVLFTTNLTSTAQPNAVAATGFTPANTVELSVLDGYTFSQGTNATTITINEAGSTPVRGQRSFNTSLNPAEFSISTYIRPNLNGGKVDADEAALWDALFGDTDGYITGTPAYTFTGSTTTATLSAAGALTVSGTGMPVVTPGIYTMVGCTGAGASEHNTALTISSSSATTLVGQYMTAPTNTSVTIPTTAALSKSAWNYNAAVAADTFVGNVAYSEVSTARSNVNQLLPFGLIIIIDSITYTLDNCVLDQATIDFGLDGIATIAWTGKAASINQLASNVVLSAAANPVASGGITGTVTGKSAQATTKYITNKLSTLSITSNVGGVGGTSYALALTGGSMQISNNVSFVTPANLGVVNAPIGYFTGTRSITGTINAYLRTGSTNSSGLLKDMLAGASGSTETKYKLQINIGGNNTTRVEALINGASLQVPTIDAQDIMSTAIQFTAQGYSAQMTSTSGYDIEQANDLRLRYFT